MTRFSRKQVPCDVTSEGGSRAARPQSPFAFFTVASTPAGKASVSATRRYSSAPLMGDTPDGDFAISFGKADVKRAGADVTVVATSLMVRESLAAAEILAKDGIEIEVADPRTIVAEQALHALKAPPMRVARPSAPLGYAPTLEKAVTPDAEKIVAAVRRMLKK